MCLDFRSRIIYIRLVHQMLNAFLEEHARDIKEASSLNLKDFRSFMYRIPGIARKSVQPVLGKREMR